MTSEVAADLPVADASAMLELVESSEAVLIAPIVQAVPAEAPVDGSLPVDATAADTVYGGMADPMTDGTGVAPTILDLEVARYDGWITVSGHITDDDLMNCYVMINGVAFWAESAGVGMDGFFEISREDNGESGWITATAYDWYGNSSATVEYWLS
jgi:hypothetical protein